MDRDKALSLAKQWASQGFPAFFVHENKIALGETHGHHDATTDARLLETLLSQAKPTRLAVAVVPGRNNYIVLDVDVKDGAQGVNQLKDLETQIGRLPKMPITRTRSGGYHLWFKKPEQCYIRNSKLTADIDVRADGGYVLAAGNDNYDWKEGRELTPDNTPVLPAEWFDLLRVGDENSAGRWGKLNPNEIDPWDLEAMEYLTDVFEVHSFFRLGNGSIGFMRKGARHNSGSIGHAGPGHIHIFTSRVSHPKDSRIALEPESNWNVEELRAYCTTKESPHHGPEMSHEAYYGPLGQAVKLFEHTEADPAAIMMCLLAGYGNMVDGNAYVETVQPIRQYSRINVLVVGASAKARKSAAWGQAKIVLKAINPEYVKDNVLGGFNSGHILVDHLHKRFTIENPTESITQPNQTTPLIVTKDRRMTVFEDEFVRVLKTVNADGSIYSAVLRSAFDGSKLEVRSRQKESEVHEGEHHISMIGCITAEELRSTLTNTEAYNGFGNRLLYVWAKRTKNVAISDTELDTEKLNDIALTLTTRMHKARSTGRLDLDEDAKELWVKVYDEVTLDDPGGLLGTLTARADVMVQRVALIFALADGSDLITRQHLEAAYAVWKYCRATAAYVFKDRALIESTNDKTKDKLKAKVYDAIYNSTHSGKHLSDLKKLPVANNSNKHLVDEILEELSSEGKITSTVVNTGTRGANPTVFFATPFAPREEQ